jgi:DNA (cytosine-5)-methyltransferase 1
MSGGLVLSLFPGIGLLDMAFEDAGFCIVRGPDKLWGGDVRRFFPPAGRFDGIIGGPPCQAFSRLRHIVKQNGYQTAPNLIPEYERVVAEAAPCWFLMENVPDAPLPVVPGYAVSSVKLNNRWVGGEQNRVRRFSFGVRGETPVELARWLDVVPLEPAQWEPAVLASGGGSRRTPVALLQGGTPRRTRPDEVTGDSVRSLAECCRLQGLPDDFLHDAPFTASGKRLVVGNGVPLPTGRAIARAVIAALEAAS